MCSRPFRPLGLPIYVGRVPAPPFSLLPSQLYLDHSHGPVLAPATQLRCRLPVRLKLVRFPPHSPLPIAALPSMSLPPKAPFPQSRRVLCRSSRSLHCISLAP